MSTRTTAFRRLEALEDRTCPSGFDSVHLVHRADGGNTLVVRGDERDNVVAIRQDPSVLVIQDWGPVWIDRFRVTIDGDTHRFSAERIDRVMVELGGGNDRLLVAPVGSVFSSVLRVTVDAGAGDDQVIFKPTPQAGNRTLDLRVDAGAGNDAVTFDLAASIVTDGLKVRVEGGEGDDEVGRFGLLTVPADVRVGLGAGADRADLTGFALSDPVNVVLHGGPGRDELHADFNSLDNL